MSGEGVELPVGGETIDTWARFAEFLEKSNRALDRQEEAAKRAGDGLDKAKDKASAFDRAMSGANTALERGHRNFSQLTNAVGTVLRVGDALLTAAEEAEAHQRAVERLGPAYDHVRAATNGTVGAMDALRAQQTLLRSGLRVSGEELGTLTRAAREYALATGEETPAALQQLTDALRQGETGGLRRFGIETQQGQTRTQAFETALRSLSAQQRGQAPAAQTLAEAHRDLGRATTEATDAFINLFTHGGGLRQLLTDAAGYVRGLVSEMRQLHDTSAFMAGREGRQQSDAADAASNDRYTASLAALRGRERATGRDIFGDLPRASALSREQRDRLSELAERYAASAGHSWLSGGESQDSQATYLRNLAAHFAERESQMRDQEQFRHFVSGLSGAGAVEGGIQNAPRDTAPTDRAAGGSPLNQAALRNAQVELGVLNESLRALAVRYERDGQLITREQQLAALRAEAGRADRQRGEDEAQRTQRVTQARAAYLQALVAERDQRRQLRDAEGGAASADAQGFLGALSTASSGGRLTGSQGDLLSRGPEIQARLAQATAAARAEVALLNAQLRDQGRSLAEQLQIRQRLAGVQQTLSQNEATLLQLGQREDNARRSALELAQQQFDMDHALIESGRTAQQQGLRATSQEADALRNRANEMARINDLERGYRQLLAQNDAELARARTDEERNGILRQRLQLMGQLQRAEAQKQALERDAARSDFAKQGSDAWNRALGAQTEQAERFGSVVTGTLNAATDAFSTHVLAVLEGSETAGQAWDAMLKTILESIAKQALVESLKNFALALGYVATFNWPAAGAAAAAGVAWGAVGIAAGAGAGAIHTGGGAGLSAGGGAGMTPSRSEPARAGGSSDGGGLVLNVMVTGVAVTDAGVGRAVTHAINAATAAGQFPRDLGRNGG